MSVAPVSAARLLAVLLLAAACAPQSAPQPTATLAPSPTPTPSPTLTASPAPTPTPEPSPTPAGAQPARLSAEQLLAMARSTVLIEALVDEGGSVVVGWTGSGTILTSSGLVLTNAHVVVGARELVIRLFNRTDRPPVPSYYAEAVQVNSVLDLALLQISRDLSGRPVDPAGLGLPAVPRGDSNQLELGDEVHVLGYPGVGGETITLTRGTVSGFESEDLGGGDLERVWIKTDAQIAPGNSGGAAMDGRGLLVGIPSMTTVDATAGRIGRMRPSNLVDYLTGRPPPRVTEASIYEPNDDPSSAYGPLQPGEVYTAYLHQNDLDGYFLEVTTLNPIEVFLSHAPGMDYDLELYDEDLVYLSGSAGTGTQERIRYQPTRTGTYYLVVYPFEGYSLEEPYSLQVNFDQSSGPPLVPDSGAVSVQGRLVDGNTGRPVTAAVVALLQPGVRGQDFLDAEMDGSLVQALGVSDQEGFFVVADVPRGRSYTVVVVTAEDVFWQDDWLTVEAGAPGVVDVGEISVNISA